MERKCEFCGEQIPQERLEALPNTRRCVKCAQKMAAISVSNKWAPAWISIPTKICWGLSAAEGWKALDGCANEGASRGSTIRHGHGQD